MRRGSDGERGFALVVVLVVTLALSLMLAAVISATRRYTEDSAGLAESLRLNAALEAGIATVAYTLSQPIYRSFPHQLTLRMNGAVVTLAVRPEVAKIDLNTADARVIAQLLRVSGLKEALAARITDEIVDWRAPPDASRPSGVGAADYVAAGRHYFPPHKAFEDISDLTLLLDGSRDLVDCLAPDVTLYTHSADVDAFDASDRVRAAMAASDRGSQQHVSVLSAGIVGGARPDLYEIIATAKDETTQRSMSRSVVLRMTGNAKDPYWILNQTSPAPTEVTASAACARIASAGQ